MKTQIFHISDPANQREEIQAAAEIIRRGGLLGIPTETVYGLGANGLNAEAVRRIFEAKGRPQDNPLILHIPGADWLTRYCRNIPPAAYVLASPAKSRPAIILFIFSFILYLTSFHTHPVFT